MAGSPRPELFRMTRRIEQAADACVTWRVAVAAKSNRSAPAISISCWNGARSGHLGSTRELALYIRRALARELSQRSTLAGSSA
jgi:hypothetical protein